MKTYTYEEALAASRAYFHGDELAATVWINKYAMKDSFGNLYEQSPEDMHHRLAKEFARIEKNYPDPLSEEQIFALLKDFRYVIPQGGPMTGIGNDHQVASLSNCFVIGHDHPADSYGGILMTDQEQVQLMKRRGGVGHDLSHIRPTGSPVLNSALTSTGVVPFMERFSNSTREEHSPARLTNSNIRSMATSRNMRRRSMPPNSGKRSSTTPGNRPSRASCSGIRSCASR